MAHTDVIRSESQTLEASCDRLAVGELWMLALRGLISAGHGLDMAATIMGIPHYALDDLACSMGLAFTDTQPTRPNRHPKAWNATEYHDLAVAWLGGSSARVIAAQIGRSASSIYGKRRFLGLPARRGAASGQAATLPAIGPIHADVAGQTSPVSIPGAPSAPTVPHAPSLSPDIGPLPHDIAVGLPLEERVGLPWLVRNSPQRLVLQTHKRTARMDWKGNRAALWEIGMRQLAGQHLKAAASDMAVSEDALRSTWSRTGLTRRSGIKSVAEFDPDLAETHRKQLGFEFLADPNMSGGHFWRRRGGPRLSRVFMKSQRYRNCQAAIG